MNNETNSGVEKDEFPIGLRVLSVDDNSTCLRILEAKLLQCRYHVTSTNSAIDALHILRMNKNNFDIIVTDVHMPDMDGFKLLEHVGLEMDLPCIMLSGNDDPKIVMKGIEHGACDYLLKPVRVEELKNIWQHVIRRKKSCKEQNHSDNTTSEDGQKNTIRNSNNKKRKEQNDEQEEEDEETTIDDDPVCKKKIRVVWTQELHQKFMDALRVLGINKAVPKKILEMMDVEGLSRENVASHLQKYRLYMRKLEERANMMTMELREYTDPGAYGSFNDFQARASSLQAFLSYQQNNTLSSNNNNPSMLFGNTHISPSLVTVARTPPMNTNTPLRSSYLHGMPSSPLLRPPPLLSPLIHSPAALNPSPLNSIPPISNHLNFGTTNNNTTLDPMLMFNGANDGQNYLNFGTSGRGANQNNVRSIMFASQPGGSSSTISSHSQLLNSFTERVLRNNSLPLPQQPKSENSLPDNALKNRDDFFLEDLCLPGDLASAGCTFTDLDNLIKPVDGISSWPPEMEQDPNN